MSDREKKLVFLFGLIAFVLLNVFAITWFKGKKVEMSGRLAAAKERVAQAVETRDRFDTVIDEMDWMADHTPRARAGQIVSTELQKYADDQAQTHLLTVNRQAILENDETGLYFHRAKVEFNVNGREDSLYRWLDRLQMPDQLRAITFIRMSPDKDDTLINCIVHVEQWYVPQSGDEEPEPEEEATVDPPVPNSPPAVPGLKLPSAGNPPPGAKIKPVLPFAPGAGTEPAAPPTEKVE